MSKAEKPTISGQRLKGRKRDEKVKFDPTSFRDELVVHLNEAENLEAAAVYLETAGNTLDYRRYADQFFDILIAGGILAPGGSIEEDYAEQSKFCVFESEGTDESIKAYVDIFNRVLRRYKYMQILLEDNLNKVLKFLKAFSEDQKAKLAKFVSFAMGTGLSSAKPLASIYIEALVKDGIAESFMIEIMRAWIAEFSINSMATAFRKSGIDIQNIFPPNKRTYDYMKSQLEMAGGLEDVLAWQESQRTSGVKKDLQNGLQAAIAEDEVTDNTKLIRMVADVMGEQKMKESDMVTLVWTAVLEAVDWNKKADMVGEQALRQLNTYAKLLAAFTASTKAQILLLVRIQIYCYDNQNLLKTFGKIVMLLYQRNVVGEDAVLDWYTRSHNSKGKTVFLAQLEPMIKWLETAEVEES